MKFPSRRTAAAIGFTARGLRVATVVLGNYGAMARRPWPSGICNVVDMSFMSPPVAQSAVRLRIVREMIERCRLLVNAQSFPTRCDSEEVWGQGLGG